MCEIENELIEINSILKPCPHCGGKAFFKYNQSVDTKTWFCYVKCHICGATGKTVFTEDSPFVISREYICLALDAWNLRRFEYKPDLDNPDLDID